MVLVWIVERSRARVVVCGVGWRLVYGCIKVLFRVVWWCIYVSMYNALVACMAVVVCSSVYG